MDLQNEKALQSQPATAANKPAVTPTTNNDYEDMPNYFKNRRVALVNASDAEIEAALTAIGYPPAIIASKLQELKKVEDLDVDQQKEYGEQYAATDSFDKLANSLHPSYLKQVKIGKLLFADNKAALNTLGLKGKRKRAEAAYCDQALLFYNGGLNDANYKAALKLKGISEDDLKNGQAGFTNLKDLIPKKIKETGEAQEATAIRDEAIEIFDEWFDEFKKYAIIALSDKPQAREKLGWLER